MNKELEINQIPIAPQVIMVLLAFILFGGGATFLVQYIVGDVQALLAAVGNESSLELRNDIRLANAISHFATFTLSTVLAAILLFKNRWLDNLHLNKNPIPGPTLGLSLILIMVAMPLVQLTYWINMQIPLPDWAMQMENTATEMLEGLLVMDSPMELIANVCILALLPAIGEEILFRGFFLQWSERILKNQHISAIVTGLLFSLFHFQMEGLIPRFILGTVLSYLFLWTKNLWIPILAHFFFNSIQIVGKYFLGDEMGALEPDKLEPNWLAGLGSLVFTVLLGWYIQQKNINKEV